MSQHTGSYKNSLNLLGEKYLNESHWPMHRIRLLDALIRDRMRVALLASCLQTLID